MYEDLGQHERLCVDALEPRLRTSGLESKPRSPSPKRPARHVCVGFGPSEDDLRQVHGLHRTPRATALSWLPGPYFAWARKAGGVLLIDHGTTSRGRSHEAHVRGCQPDGIELAQAVAAAELVHWGRLSGVAIRATAAGAAQTEIRHSVRIGRRASWASSLGDVLVAALAELLRRDRLQITVASGPVSLAAFDEVRELVLMEWAHRLAGGQPLSMPAASISGLIQDRGVDLTIDWRDGDRVPLRAVRSLRYESIVAGSMRSLTWALAAGERSRVPARA